MATQIEIEGNIFNVYQAVKYVFQVNDIAEISDRKATYTTSWKLPRTKEVTATLEGLGLVGDTSTSPYRRVICRLYENYVPIVERGWLDIVSTEEQYYNISVISGIVDFFRAIENSTLQDLDLSEIEHEKTIANMAASWNAEPPLPYRYHIADYGGFNHYQRGGFDTVVNIGYQIPSVSVKYIWDKIFSAFGFTYSGSVFNDEDFTDLWITFPKTPPDVRMQDEPAKYPLKENYVNEGQWAGGDPITDYDDWDATAEPCVPPCPDYITVNPDNWTMTVNEAGTYAFRLQNLQGHILYGNPLGTQEEDTFFFTVTHDGTTILSISRESEISNPLSEPIEQIVTIGAGETLDFTITRAPHRLGEDAWELVIDEIDLQIHKLTAVITPQEDFVELSINDFFKEILWRFALIPFADKYTNDIRFITFDELIAGEVVDWSDKYVRRTKEEYVYGYEKNNWMRYQYDEDDQAGSTGAYNDGIISVHNENLNSEQTLITSNTYSPNRQERFFAIDDLQPEGIQVHKFKKFDGQERIEDGEQILDYETIDDRFFFVRGVLQQKNITLGNIDIQGSEQRISDFYSASFEGLDYQSIINKYYAGLGGVLDNTRIHTIELALTPVDANQLDLRKVYYFEQEANYYILNNLNYTEGEISTGEFIRIIR